LKNIITETFHLLTVFFYKQGY